jgi:AcrR family transcriptional regulator
MTMTAGCPGYGQPMPRSKPRPGRPAGPSAATRETVLRGALDLLLNEGAAALTPQRLHEVTGVARSTVYRHWPDADALVDALLDVAEQTEAPDLTGDVRSDLDAAINHLLWRLRNRPVASFLGSLMAGPISDERVAARRNRYIAGLLQPLRAALRQVQPPLSSAAIEDAANLIAGPLLAYWLAHGRVPDGRRARSGLRAAETAGILGD